MLPSHGCNMPHAQLCSTALNSPRLQHPFFSSVATHADIGTTINCENGMAIVLALKVLLSVKILLSLIHSVISDPVCWNTEPEKGKIPH